MVRWAQLPGGRCEAAARKVHRRLGANMDPLWYHPSRAAPMDVGERKPMECIEDARVHFDTQCPMPTRLPGTERLPDPLHKHPRAALRILPQLHIETATSPVSRRPTPRPTAAQAAWAAAFTKVTHQAQLAQSSTIASKQPFGNTATSTINEKARISRLRRGRVGSDHRLLRRTKLLRSWSSMPNLLSGMSTSTRN